jgi:acetylornithine deacetylase/succinyl-diaminopimelate desuccinylase-like protein
MSAQDGTDPRRDVDRATLREVVETLAPLERRAGSAGERAAAEWIAERLTRAGAPAHVEDATFRGGYARLVGVLAAAGAAAGLLGLSRRGRAAAIVGGIAAAAGIADDVSNGPRLARRATTKPQPTWNVVAEAGDPAAPRTLVVMAHHDAAPTGAIFDQTGSAGSWRSRPGCSSGSTPRCRSGGPSSAARPSAPSARRCGAPGSRCSAPR